MTSNELPNLKLFTGETLVDRHFSLIRSSWYKTTDGILELSQRCADADRELAGASKKALITKLPFGRATFSKLATIGHDLRLRSIAGLLPQSFSTLYELTQFNDDQLNSALNTGAIHPQVRRAEIQSLRKPHVTTTKESTTKELPEAVMEIAAGDHCELIVPHDHCAQVKKLLLDLHKTFGVEIVVRR